jgi:hypothetical protein
MRILAMTVAVLVLMATPACRGGDGSDMPAQDINTVMEAHADELMAIEGVTAVGVGARDDGTPCIKVFVVEKSETLEKRIPGTLGGHPVVVVESGAFEPMSSEDD